MIVYLATYPRCGHSVLRWLLKLNFGLGGTNWEWDRNPGDRAALSRATQMHLVKTHHPPLDAYLPGEVAIQLIRHPGPTIASHYTLHHLDPEATRPLNRFIRGQANTGDWTTYHSAWAQAALPFLRLRYEDVTDDPGPGVAAIATFLGLPEPEQALTDEPQAAKARNPTRNPIAGPEAWRSLFDPADMALLREKHGALAASYGYDI